MFSDPIFWRCKKMEEKKYITQKIEKEGKKIESNGFPKPGPVHLVCTDFFGFLKGSLD
jgi:hypothetical protein